MRTTDWSEAPAVSSRDALCEQLSAFVDRSTGDARLRAAALLAALAPSSDRGTRTDPDDLPSDPDVGTPDVQTLRRVAADPVPADRALLVRALEPSDDPRLAYLAVHGLEALGEQGEIWEGRLVALARAGPAFVRLRALAALGRSGQGWATVALAAAATGSEATAVRAEALRWLGELAAAEHEPLFERVLAEPPGRYEVWGDRASLIRYPTFEESALGLARAGTESARRILVGAYFEVRHSRAMPLIASYLDQMLTGGEVVVSPDTWRRSFRWVSWRPAR